jgi:hypothetical protein
VKGRDVKNLEQGFMLDVKKLLILAALWMLSCSSAAIAPRCWAEDKPSEAKTSLVPLAGLPSKPGAHIAKIRELGDDAWLPLGKPAPDPKWGAARGRSWAAKMPLAPELRAAFLFGEGVHGWWNRKTGRYMDDLWAYDINGHRWVCVYPGADVHNLDLRLDKDGFEVTRDGMPLPVAQMGHGYEAVSYDTHLKQFLFMPCPADYWQVLKERRMRWLKDKGRLKQASASPWAYDTKTGRWERRAVGGESPRSGFGHVLIYVASKKQTFFWGSGGDVWFYNHAANRWTKKSPKGPSPPFGIDPTACLDTKRERICMGGGSYPVAKGPNALWIYDIKTNAWIDPRPEGKPCAGSNSYATNIATMTYDSAADLVLVNRHGGPKDQRGLFVYDPRANAWTGRLKPYPRECTWQSVNAFYDEALNAHFFHTAGDSRDDGTMWVYRLKAVKR